MTPPTTTKPAMTPPFREEPPLLASVLVVVGLPEKVSMAFCATHSSHAQPLSVGLAEPNTCWMVSCLSAQVAVLLSAEGAAQEVPKVPLRVSMMLVRFVSCTAPQKVVLVIHVHLRF